jgi:glycosyltransferase involved in cell wall biosynthesis
MNLSIVIPVFNSEKILSKLVFEIRFKLKYFPSYEIIFVNDNSSDKSWSEILKLKKKYKNIKGINLANNCGQHSAIYIGFKYALGEVIITMDDDFQHPPNSILKIYNKLKKFHLCYAKYKKRKHSKWKKVVSYLNNIFASLIFNKPFYVYFSSFRGIKKSVIKDLLKKKQNIIFLDGLLIEYSKKITFVNVNHRKRFKGNSTYNIKNLLYLWFDMINNYQFKPIRFGSFVGFFAKLFIQIINLFLKRKNSLKEIKIKEKTF